VVGEIAFVALTSDELDPMQLRRIAEVEVRRRLLGVDGVSQVVPIGGQEKQYQILVDPHRLERYGLGLADVVSAIERAAATRLAATSWLAARSRSSACSAAPTALPTWR
jgi:Cu/Ag efflux pump CusA